MKDEERKEYERFLQAPHRHGNSFTITPFGKAKSIKESSSQNAIYKIIQIKKEERQADNVLPSILWLDLQSNPIRDMANKRWANPISIFNDYWCPGILWYAFYAKKDLQIIEGRLGEISQIKMDVDGRFANGSKSKFDFSIISLPESTLIFQNPNSQKNIPVSLYMYFTHLPRFDFAHSWMNWPDKTLNERIYLEYKKICNFYEWHEELCTLSKRQSNV